MAPRKDALACPWKGVSLGGWLLLEPGPASPFFEECAQRAAAEAAQEGSEAQAPGDEHGLCTLLEAAGGRELKQQLFRGHREGHYCASTFRHLRDAGLNAVRVPFGYWVVTGPTRGEPFVGPGLQHLDRAVDMAERFGIQVVLDLHGNPGGESGDPPCGRRNRAWTQACWRRDEALRVLEIVARRYAGRRCVAGIQVSNEPSRKCEMGALCDWFERAIEVIRRAGMQAGDVAIIVPVYDHDRLEEFVPLWMLRGNFLRFENVVLDLHYYHCFGGGWQRLDHGDHLAEAAAHGRVLQSLPGAMVGEWSLSRPGQVLATDAMEREFGEAQLRAYAAASHGWFFWNFCDSEEHWDLATCLESGWLPGALGPGPPAEGAVPADEAWMARRAASGSFPACYGSEGCRAPPGHEPPSAEQAARGLAEAVGCTVQVAAEVLAACGGDQAEAAVLLTASSPSAGASGENGGLQRGQKRTRSPGD
mmetsp:Transcript_45657/g.141122  ORF Transcript_45657/g.141122 Transcript_45657/m.141122 type:complete len:476 (+) Transcript_45657:44-1471(+)